MHYYENMNIYMKRFLPRNTKGFTLIELLVVVAIIAILTIIAISIYAGVQKKARDSRRQAEVDSLAKSVSVRKDPVTAKYIYDGGGLPDTSAGNQDYPQAAPQDPVGSAGGWTDYCYATGATTPANPASWNGACSVIGWSTVPNVNTSTLFASPGVSAWKICTMLESTNPPKVFCKGNI